MYSLVLEHRTAFFDRVTSLFHTNFRFVSLPYTVVPTNHVVSVVGNNESVLK